MTILKNVRLNGTVNFPVDYVTSGLQVYYDAGNPKSYPGSGNSWFNLVSSAATATMTGTTYTADKNGGLVFSGTATGVSSGFAWTNNAFTLSVWVYPTTVDASIRRFVTLQDSTANFNWGVSRLDGAAGTQQLHSYVSHSGGTFVSLRNNNQVIANTYQNFVTTWSGTQIVHYKNNTFLNSNTTGAVTIDYSATGNTVRISSAGEPFAGNMYIIMLYDRLLTATERIQNYNAFRGRFGL